MSGEAPRLDPAQSGPTMRPWLAEEVLARPQAAFPQVAGRFPHETEGYLRQRIDELRQESAKRSQEFYTHLLAQGSLQSLEQQRQQEQQDQSQQDDLQGLGLDLSAGMSELPQALPGIEERLHEMGPRLRPEEYDSFLGRIGRAKEMHGMVSAARQAALRTISEALGERIEGDESLTGRAGQILSGVKEGAMVGEAPTLRSNIVRGLLQRQKELEATFLPLPEQQPEPAFGVPDPSAQAAVAQTDVDRKRQAPPPSAGLEPDQVRQLLATTMAETLEQEMAGGLDRAGTAGDVRAEVGHLIGMLLPFGGGLKAGGGAAKALLPKALTGATSRGGKALTFVAEQMGGMGLLAGVGYALPLSPEQMFHVEQAEGDQQDRLQDAYRLMNGIQMGPMLLAYEMGGGLGRLVGRAVPRTMPVTRGAAEGLGLGAMFPAAAEGGMVGVEELAKVVAPHSEKVSALADLLAMQHPGPVKRFVQAIRAGDPEQMWEATRSYVQALGVPSVTFASLGVMRGLGMKFTASARRDAALAEAGKEIDSIEGLDSGQRQALKERLAEQTKDMAPEAVVEKRAEIRRQVEEKLGGAEEADRALSERLMVERVPRPEGSERRGEGLEARRQEIVQARERAEERAAAGDEAAERQVRSLRLSELATEHLQAALRAEAPKDRIRHEERAQRLLEASREAAEGRPVEVPGFGPEPEARRRALAQRVTEEIRAEAEIETLGPKVVQAREAERAAAPGPPEPARLQEAVRALRSGDILTRADERVLIHPEVLPRLVDRHVRRLATRAGLQVEGVPVSALRTALAPAEPALRSMPLHLLADVARAKGVPVEGREQMTAAILGRGTPREARVASEPSRPGSKGPADRIELDPRAAEQERSVGTLAARQLLEERFVAAHPEAGAAAPYEVMRGLGEGVVRLGAIFHGDHRYLRRAERMAGTVRFGVKRDSIGLMRFLGTAPGLFGTLGREMTAVLARIEKGLSIGRKLISRLSRTIKEDSEESKLLVRLLKSRDDRESDPEAWAQATPERERIVQQLDRFFSVYRRTLAEHHPTSVQLARVRDEQVADAQRLERDLAGAERMLQESWDAVEPMLRAEYMALRKRVRNARGEDKEALQDRLLDVSVAIDEMAPSNLKPAEWQDRIAAIRRSAANARRVATSTERQRQSFIEQWGQMRSYVPSISAIPQKELAEIVKRSMDRPNGLLPEDLWDHLIAVRAGHMKKKTGGLEAKGIEETDLIRILYHYMHRTIPAMEINSFVARHWQDIYGRRRRASPNEVKNPWVTEERGRFTHLEYWDPARNERIDVRSRGEHLKLEDGTYVRADRLGKDELSKARAAKRVRRMAGMRKPGGEPERVVLLDRRVQRQPDGSFSRENSVFRPDDAQWMQRHEGSFIEIPSWQAGYHVYTRQSGLAQLLSKRQLGALEHKLGTLSGVAAERMTGHPMFSRIERVLRRIATGFGWLKIGALSPHAGAGIFQGAYFLNTILWGPRIAGQATTLTARYLARLTAADVYANPLEQMARAREVPLGERPDTLFPASERLRTDPSKLEQMSERARQRRIELDDAMVDFHRSWISVGQKTMEFRDLGRTTETGKKITGPSLRKGAEAASNLGYAFVDAGEMVVRSSQYLHAHTLARRNGYSREQARRLAEDVVMATHGVFNRAFKSSAMQTGLGMLIGTLTNWFQHAAGVFSRRIAGSERGREPLPFSTDAELAIRQRLTANLTSGSGAAFLARYFVGAVAITKIGELLGVDWSHTVGSVVDDTPVVGPTLDAWLRGVGRETSADPLGVERKALVRGDLGELREKFAAMVGKLPYLGPTLAETVRVLGLDFSSHEGGIPIPVMPFTVSGPMESILRYGNQWARAKWFGDEEAQDKATRGFWRNVAGRQVVELHRALTTEKTELGDYERKEGGEVVERYPHSGWEQWALSILGPPLFRQVEWMEKTLSLKRKAIERAQARSEGYELEGVLRDQIALERDVKVAGGRVGEDLSAAAGDLKQRKEKVLRSVLERKYGIEGRAMQRFDAGAPRDALEKETFAQARRYLRSANEQARLRALAGDLLETRERDVLHAADSSKAEGLRQLTRLLRDKSRPVPEQRAVVMWKLMIGKEARAGDPGALRRWAAGAPRDVVDDFLSAWKQANETWRDK